jgi:hypothetical protein
LEEAAMRHPAVQEAAVVAIQHPRWQERPFLIVVPAENAVVTTEELRTHLLMFVPKWWLPDAIAFATELPTARRANFRKTNSAAASRTASSFPLRARSPDLRCSPITQCPCTLRSEQGPARHVVLRQNGRAPTVFEIVLENPQG